MRSFVLFLFLVTSAAAGPIFPSRQIILAPKFRDKADTARSVRYLSEQGIWGGLSRGFESEGDRYAWSIAFGGGFELVSWQNSNLWLVGDIDVLSDTHNDISFNPRSVFWTEGLLYGIRIASYEIHAGYIHRCKHDIDNYGPNDIGANEERLSTVRQHCVSIKCRPSDLPRSRHHSSLIIIS